MKPEISFIITTFNSGKFLKNCIDSCLNQYQHNVSYEIIIINDGSTDNTDKILSKYTQKNIKTFFIENSGIEKAVNYAFEKADGKYFVRVDADDYLHLKFLKNIQKYLTNNKTFIYTNYWLVDEFKNVLKKIELPKFDINEIKKRGDFMASGTIYPRTIIEQVGGYQTNFKNCGLENYEMILKIIDRGFQGFVINDPLVFYRRHGENMSENKRKLIIEYGDYIAKKFKLEKYQTNEYHPYGLVL